MTAGAAARPQGVDHPSLVPALLLADAGAGPYDPGTVPPRVRRSVRDWVVDVCLFLTSVAIGLVLVDEASRSAAPPPDWLLRADLLVGVLACVALWWRRRWPVGVGLVLAAVGTFSDMGGFAVLVSLFTVAVHRPWPPVLLVTAANVAAFLVYVVVRPVHDLPQAVFLALGLVLTAAVVAWGMFVRARRQLVLSLRERAARAEAEQRLRVEQARQLERTRIAREMHDVLAHRLSLLSMHAGALEFRPDASPAEVAGAAGVIRASARDALEDLRAVIGVLRTSQDAAAPERPQPTLADLPALVEESRRAGLRAHVEYRAPDVQTVPDVTGRTVYRVVQEALTNVRKHAGGTTATILVSGGPAEGLTVEVTNPPRLGADTAEPLPGAGTGLVGLLERVGLAGGHLDHGWTADGHFRVRAWLPWAGAGSAG
ncbi:sensor histidine kinase [Blastococcus sp. TF02A-35]|nr:sensor histidine kinase [Blastococcus sp. TF02A_35]